MAAGQFYRGENLRLSFQGDKLFHATTCSLEYSTETEELASKDIQGTEVNMGKNSGTLSCDSLLADKPTTPTGYADAFDLMQYQKDKTLLDFEFTSGVTGDKIISGQCYVTGTTLNAENQQVGTGSFSFLVNGDITIDVVS
ncbi:hypothetical protein HX109_15390 [Galbibacter sp. BG1]|uniref:hypothetical protein n=1 Tax=Galbibacter sp. BG1 TaxID=1170699 RepID=UPI0015BAE552|nr:hypothetical protein [Galbibacter sp. BG1]QLE02883.1 hypothetical protein HX109_15390 [Galbibacter sp. BG1]